MRNTKNNMLLVMKRCTEEFNYNQKIKGHLGELSKNRLVFVGRHSEDDGWFLAFQNEKGDQTKLSLSDEAMALVMRLYNKDEKGNDIFPIKIETKWEIIE